MGKRAMPLLRVLYLQAVAGLPGQEPALSAKADYGFGSVAWEHPPIKAPERSVPRYVPSEWQLRCSGSWKKVDFSWANFSTDPLPWRLLCFHHPPSCCMRRSADLRKRGLSRRLEFPASQIGPYRILVFIRLCAMIGFLLYRVTNPTDDGFWLWLMSVICEIWCVATLNPKP